MRSLAFAGLTAVMLSAMAAEARAQQGYFGRTSVTRARVVGDRNEFASASSRTTGYSANGEYRRARVEPPPRTQPPPAPAASRSYFPGLPTGYGPNRNYIDPSTLCVPGRRAFIYGR